MKAAAVSSRCLGDRRDLTPGRVGLGRTGAGMPTRALLEFTLDHARARDAVHAAFDVSALISGLADLGLEAFDVASRACDRKDYLRRPHLGRTLDQASQQRLPDHKRRTCRLAILLRAGLSPTPVHPHPFPTFQSLIPSLTA